MTIKTKKMTLKTFCVSALALASLCGGPANAKLFDITFSGIGGSGKAQVDAILVSPGYYDVESIFGFGNGSKITELSAYASADNYFSYPVSNPGDPYVSFSGLSFATAAGPNYNLYSWNSGYYEVSSAVDAIGYPQNGTPISLTVSVPEVSTWMMMFAGFTLLGFVGYRRAGRTVRA
jgi:hypothetical protein